MLKAYRETITNDWKDPDFQREFLTAMYEEGGAEGVVQGLREIAIATRSMGQVASLAGVARTTLYRSLSRNGNRAFKTVHAALDTLGLEIAIVPKKMA